MRYREDIDRLKTRLQWESAGPLAYLTNQAVTASLSTAEAMAAWVREKGEERPLVSVLFAFQLGFAAGRWGSRRAKH